MSPVGPNASEVEKSLMKSPEAKSDYICWNPLFRKFRSHMRVYKKLLRGEGDENDVEAFVEVMKAIRRNYAYAIPNRKAIETLVAWSPIVELGAGTGYWAKLIHDAGGRITAFDKHPPPDIVNPYKFIRRHFPVNEGGEEILQSYREIEQHTLFLCWPPHGTSFAWEAIRSFRGRRLAYIGSGPGGCTADDDFHQELERGWRLENRLEIPQWPEMGDALFLYCR